MPKLQHFLLIFLLMAFGGPRFAFADKKVGIVELANAWTLRNQNGSIRVSDLTVPTGVYTALRERFGDVLISTNVDKLRWIAYDNWTYSTTFNVNQADYDRVRAVNLTLNGIDTVAKVRLNNVDIGITYNMFMRYSFDVLPFLQSENVLEIEIYSPILSANKLAMDLAADGVKVPPDCPPFSAGECHRNMLRKMQLSFGSMWSPAVPTMGIWKSVLLEYHEVAIMRDVDIALKRNDSHWIMDMRIFLSAGMSAKFFGEVTLFAPELLADPVVQSYENISYKSPTIELVVAVRRDNITLWWPNGYGAQKLYPLFFSTRCWLSADGPNTRINSISQKSLQIGFRTIELVEDVDAYGRTFFFKVNEVPIFIKGAVYMPAHILPALAEDKEQITYLLQSARDAHMNMIRVWAGGLYESDFFYNLADTLGLLVWQDLPFTDAAYPMTENFINSVVQEVVQNAQRLAYHPSLALMVTNDEIEWLLMDSQIQMNYDMARLTSEYKQFFMGTVMHELDVVMSRYGFSPRPGPMVSTPSKGIEESKKYSLTDPQSIKYGDVHFITTMIDGWNVDVYPRARFISKYGFPSLPILVSWNRTVSPEDSLTDIIKYRQQDPRGFDSMMHLIQLHLPLPAGEWTVNVDTYIYLSQVAQAMASKTATELFRSESIENRTMGALYWHLNDLNVAPSASLIDFYGNRKLVYYWSKQFLAPIAVFALYDAKQLAINVTVVREDNADDRDPRIYDITMNTYLWSDLYAMKTITWQVILGTNSAKQRILPLDAVLSTPFNATNCFLEFSLSDAEHDAIISSTYFFPGEITQATGMTKPELAFELSTRHYQNHTETCTVTYTITVFVRRPALFVYLEIRHPLITNYRLSQNGFIQTDPVKTISLIYDHHGECLKIDMEHIRVRTMNDLMVGDGHSATTGR